MQRTRTRLQAQTFIDGRFLRNALLPERRTWLLMKQGGQLGEHFFRDVTGHLFDEASTSCLQIENARLVAHDDSLGPRSRIHQRDGGACAAGEVAALGDWPNEWGSERVERLGRDHEYVPGGRPARDLGWGSGLRDRCRRAPPQSASRPTAGASSQARSSAGSAESVSHWARSSSSVYRGL